MTDRYDEYLEKMAMDIMLEESVSDCYPEGFRFEISGVRKISPACYIIEWEIAEPESGKPLAIGQRASESFEKWLLRETAIRRDEIIDMLLS